MFNLIADTSISANLENRRGVLQNGKPVTAATAVTNQIYAIKSFLGLLSIPA